jgi:hypothetical protein
MHITLSSARYSFASLQLGGSLRFTSLKNASIGPPFIASQLNKQYAPGRTELNPKKLSQALSGV